MNAPPIFVSVFAYSFGKKHFPRIAEACAHEITLGEKSEIPGFRTAYRLRKLVDRIAFVPECSTLIGKARCLVAGKFLRSGCPLWVTIDDDVDADLAALSTLVNGVASVCAPAQGPHPTPRPPAIVYGAMKTRVAWATRYNVGFRDVDASAGGEWVGRTGQLVPLSHGGAALMAVPREALERMCAHFPELYFEEEEEAGSPIVHKNPALFLEELVDGEPRSGRTVRAWLGEDVMFSRRAEAAGVPRYGFIHPGIVHAGIPSL